MLGGFFTAWALAAHAVLPRDRRLALAVVVSVTGAYITYVHPRRIVVVPGRVVVDGPALVVADLLLHHLPLLVLLLALPPGGVTHHARASFGVAAALLLAYALVFPDAPLCRYGLSDDDCARVAVAMVPPLAACVISS